MRTTIEMAREAAGDDWGLFQEYMPEIHRLVELVRADERARMAEQPTQQCKWPTCQSEEYQQALAEQIKRELVGEQPAQQEPVATVKAKREGGTFVHWTKLPVAGMTLYTTPPAQRKPLTDEQREEIAKGWRGRNWTVGDIIDATEAAHGIKENT